jgi:hypothetical protein
MRAERVTFDDCEASTYCEEHHSPLMRLHEMHRELALSLKSGPQRDRIDEIEDVRQAIAAVAAFISD